MKKTVILLFCFLGITQFSKAYQTQTDLNGLFKHLEKNNKFMGSVYVVKAGKPIFEHTYGYQVQPDVPINSTTQFRIGSISKTFTSVLILKLVEDGKLKLDTTLDSYFPTVKNAKEITIELMLRHGSGIKSYTEDSEYLTFETKKTSTEELVKRISSYDPAFNPGEKNEYSNSNFFLLGKIVEIATKMPYQSYLEKVITKPLDLKYTRVGGAIETSKNQANSFHFKNDEWESSSETNMSVPGGAGFIISTPRDLSTFFTALFTGKVLKQETISTMTKTVNNYGMGIFKAPMGPNNFGYLHDGGIDGFISHASYFPNDSLFIGITSNGFNYTMNNLVINTYKFSKGAPITLPDLTSVRLNEEELDNYIGVYSAPNFPLKITILTNSGNLMAQATGQPAFPLTAKSKQKFTFEDAGITIIFGEPTDGKYLTFDFTQGPNQFKFAKE